MLMLPFARRTATGNPFASPQVLPLQAPRPTTAQQTAALPWDERAGAVLQIPHALRAGPAPSTGPSHERVLSLDDIFPGSGLGAVFDGDAAFRTLVRSATRADLFVPNPRWSTEANSAMRGLNSTLVMDWRLAERGCPTLDAALASRGLGLSGSNLILGLGALCGGSASVAGSLTDIVATREAVAHSWHQDSGLRSFTVLLGFPGEDGYDGGGVFSHVVRLSHPLRTQNAPSGVIEWERYEPPVGPMDEGLVVRPRYCRGREVLMYCDCDTLHSAPDRMKREAVWRFM